MSLLKTNTAKDHNKPTRVKNVHSREKKPRKLKMQKQSEDTVIKNIRNLFRLKGENETVKNNIIRDIKTLFVQQNKDYYKPLKLGYFIILNMKVMVIEIKPYQS